MMATVNNPSEQQETIPDNILSAFSQQFTLSADYESDPFIGAKTLIEDVLRDLDVNGVSLQKQLQDRDAWQNDAVLIAKVAKLTGWTVEHPDFGGLAHVYWCLPQIARQLGVDAESKQFKTFYQQYRQNQWLTRSIASKVGAAYTVSVENNSDNPSYSSNLSVENGQIVLANTYRGVFFRSLTSWDPNDPQLHVDGLELATQISFPENASPTLKKFEFSPQTTPRAKKFIQQLFVVPTAVDDIGVEGLFHEHGFALHKGTTALIDDQLGIMALQTQLNKALQALKKNSHDYQDLLTQTQQMYDLLRAVISDMQKSTRKLANDYYILLKNAFNKLQASCKGCPLAEVQSLSCYYLQPKELFFNTVTLKEDNSLIPFPSLDELQQVFNSFIMMGMMEGIQVGEFEALQKSLQEKRYEQAREEALNLFYQLNGFDDYTPYLQMLIERLNQAIVKQDEVASSLASPALLSPSMCALKKQAELRPGDILLFTAEKHIPQVLLNTPLAKHAAIYLGKDEATGQHNLAYVDSRGRYHQVRSRLEKSFWVSRATNPDEGVEIAQHARVADPKQRYDAAKFILNCIKPQAAPSHYDVKDLAHGLMFSPNRGVLIHSSQPSTIYERFCEELQAIIDRLEERKGAKSQEKYNSCIGTFNAAKNLLEANTTILSSVEKAIALRNLMQPALAKKTRFLNIFKETTSEKKATQALHNILRDKSQILHNVSDEPQSPSASSSDVEESPFKSPYKSPADVQMPPPNGSRDDGVATLSRVSSTGGRTSPVGRRLDESFDRVAELSAPDIQLVT